jgi:hypothetical protein
MVRKEPQIECSTASIPIKKWQWKNPHIQAPKIKLDSIQSKLAAPCAYKSTLVKPEPDTAAVSTVASYWARSGNNDPQAKILARRAYRNSEAGADFRAITVDEMGKERPCKGGRYVAMGETTGVRVNSSRDIPDGALSAEQFKNKSDAKNNSITSGTRFQARQKTLKSEYDFKQHGVVSGNKATVPFNEKAYSTKNGDISAKHVRVGHFVIRTLAQNTNTEDGLRHVGDGRNFQQSGSNRNEKGCFQQTYEMKSEIMGMPRIRQLQRKNRHSAGPAPRRPILNQLTSDSLSSERLESKLAYSTKSVGHVLDDTGEDSVVKHLSGSQTEQGDMDTEELLLGDDKDTEEDKLGEIDNVVNDLSLIHL